MADRVEVHGGTGGVAADLEDQRRWAGILQDASAALGDVLARTTDDRDVALLARTAVWSPVGAVTGAFDLLGGRARLAALVAGTAGLASVLRTRAALLEAADVWPGRIGRGMRRELSPLLALAAGGYVAARSGLGEDAATGASEGLREVVTAAPWLVEAVVDSGAELLDEAVPGPYEPNSPRETVVALLLAFGSQHGRFDDRPIALRRWTPFIAPLPAGAPRGPMEEPPPPGSLGELATNLNLMMDATRHDAGASIVGITRVDGPGGPAWIVQLPGTQEWDPVTGPDPSDLTTNLLLSGGRESELVNAALATVRSAGIQPGDPIMTAGHSQGGIAATDLADALHHDGYAVTHVVTFGSPVANLPLPPGVEGMSIEHRDDLVPRLDAAPNRDDRNRTTVVTDSHSHPDQGPVGPHSLLLYAETATTLRELDDPSVDAWLTSAGSFFGQAGETRWTTITRTPPRAAP